MIRIPPMNVLIKRTRQTKGPPAPRVKQDDEEDSTPLEAQQPRDVSSVFPPGADTTRLLFHAGFPDDDSSMADSQERFRIQQLELGQGSVLLLPSLHSSSSAVQPGAKKEDKDVPAEQAKKQPQESTKKKSAKQPLRMPRLGLWEYLRVWDVSSNAMRDEILSTFMEEYTSADPLDFDYFLSKGGSLIFTRFAVGMQLSFQRKKSVERYFKALVLFIQSLQGERYAYEFAIMGGLITTFEVLRVDEMTTDDKTEAFCFLRRLIDGQGGTRVKYLICSDTSYLESVVDCLTMCRNELVVTQAQFFLQQMCVGNTTSNLFMISKYVISLLPCDFNPRVQAMACRVLPGLIRQVGDIASSCYNLVVDVLRTDYTAILVDVGDLCISMMATSTADDILVALIEAAQPINLSDDLTGGTESYYSLLDSEIPIAPTHDMYFRLQYGALNVLSYMVKNRTEYADWMIEKGLIGSLLTGIGTASHTEVQMGAIQLLTLVHDLSPDCSLALSYLLPKKFLVVFMNEGEEILEYLTAPMCLVLRQLGHLVQANWDDWFSKVALPRLDEPEPEEPASEETDEGEEGEEEAEEIVQDTVDQIKELVALLDHMVGDPFSTIVEDMELVKPDSHMFQSFRDQDRLSSRALGSKMDKLTPGEAHIMDTPDLEGFRKYLHNENEIVERVDEFEKYYAAKFAYDSEQVLDMGGMEMAALQDAERAIAKLNEENDEAKEDAAAAEEDEDQQVEDDVVLDAELEAAFT